MADFGEDTARPKKLALGKLFLAALCILLVVMYNKGSAQAPQSAPDAVPAVNLSGRSFQQSIRSGVYIVDFWAEWCGPCHIQSPILDSVARRYAGRAAVAKVNVDVESDLARQYNVRGLPTIIVFKDGVERKRFMGVTDERELGAVLDALM